MKAITHPANRCNEHYGIKLDQSLYNTLTRWIKYGNPRRVRFYCPANKGASIYKILIKKKAVFTIWSERYHQIKSFCNYDAALKYKRKWS